MIIAIFSILLVIVFLAVLYYIKWSQNYKLILYVGKKGSGKSTRLCADMMRYHKKGYRIYTTMNECVLPYVNHITIDMIGSYVGEPKSLICIDECGIFFDNRKYKSFKDEWRDYFKFQRHYKNVVIMASQAADIDVKLRNLIDELYLITSFGPVSIARKIVRKIALTEASSVADSRIADQLNYAPGGFSLLWMPRYRHAFSSFAPPKRPYFPTD